VAVTVAVAATDCVLVGVKEYAIVGLKVFVAVSVDVAVAATVRVEVGTAERVEVAVTAGSTGDTGLCLREHAKRNNITNNITNRNAIIFFIYIPFYFLDNYTIQPYQIQNPKYLDGDLNPTFSYTVPVCSFMRPRLNIFKIWKIWCQTSS
jgi:hypothetical protein